MEEIYLYHRVPKFPVHKSILVSLNELKKERVDLSEEYLKKYSHRMHELEQVIPPLNCLWNDVVYMTPVHPNEYRKLMDEVGLSYPNRFSFFKIPVSMLNKNLCTIWKFEIESEKSKKSSFDDYLEFNEENIVAAQSINDITREYFRRAASRKREQYLIHYAIPHIMYKGTIDITNLEII